MNLFQAKTFANIHFYWICVCVCQMLDIYLKKKTEISMCSTQLYRTSLTNKTLIKMKAPYHVEVNPM